MVGGNVSEDASRHNGNQYPKI